MDPLRCRGPALLSKNVDQNACVQTLAVNISVDIQLPQGIAVEIVEKSHVSCAMMSYSRSKAMSCGTRFPSAVAICEQSAIEQIRTE